MRWSSNLNAAPVVVSGIEWSFRKGPLVPSALTEERGGEPIRQAWHRGRVSR